MSFVPGPSRDLLRPEPGSTTGRAIASLSLRRLNEDFAALGLESIEDAPARAAFEVFRREMDALLPGRPKERVAVLDSPFVRAPLERALYGGEGTHLDAALAGLFALQLGPGLSDTIALAGDAARDVFARRPLVRARLEGAPLFPLPEKLVTPLAAWSVNDLRVSSEAGAAFGFDSREAADAQRARLEAASRLLDAAASTEAAELARFFGLVVPLAAGLERQPGVLGLTLGEPISIALDVVEALALEKLGRYARLVGGDAEALTSPARHLVRHTFLRWLERVRHPAAATPEARRHLAAEEDALSGIALEPAGEGALAGIVEELARLR